jgi:hypothetical protein
LRRETDGLLFDIDERRRVELGELRDNIRDGRFFEAVRHSTGEDCTHEVLNEVLLLTLPKPPIDGAGLSSLASTLLGGMFSGLNNKPWDTKSDRKEDREDDRAKPKGRSNDRHAWWEGE